MDLKELQARVDRLDQLSRGLSKEVTIWRKGNDPLLYLERKAYLGAIQDALAGFRSFSCASHAVNIQTCPSIVKPSLDFSFSGGNPIMRFIVLAMFKANQDRRLGL